MSDDLLSRATRALREETAGDDSGARFTRSRIMASVHEERVRRRTRWAFLIPIAATFVAASAFGAVTGTAHHALEVVARALGIHRESAPAPRPASARPTAARAVRSAPAPAAPPPATLEPPAPEATAPPLALAPKTVSAVAAAPPTAKAGSTLGAATPAPSGSSAANPALDLYRAAHQAHFIDRDWSRALHGWDAYLRAAPSGALVPEARYNRALCLLRLHRNDEARAALTPFAQGHYGTYRREDAEKLLEAMPAGLSGP